MIAIIEGNMKENLKKGICLIVYLVLFFSRLEISWLLWSGWETVLSGTCTAHQFPNIQGIKTIHSRDSKRNSNKALSKIKTNDIMIGFLTRSCFRIWKWQNWKHHDGAHLPQITHNVPCVSLNNVLIVGGKVKIKMEFKPVPDSNLDSKTIAHVNLKKCGT